MIKSPLKIRGLRVRAVNVPMTQPHRTASGTIAESPLVRQLREQGVPDDDARRITWKNASELFRHPVPDALQR